MTGNGMTDWCDNHPQMNAIDSCVVCGKPVCGDCAISNHGKYFCNDTSHHIIFETHTLFCESRNMFEIELIAKNLEENGIPVRWFDLRQYRESSLPVLYVLNGSEGKAMSTLKALELLDFIIPENNAR